MNLNKTDIKRDNSGTFYVRFHDFNEKNFFSIYNDYYKLSFYFSFEEEKLQPNHSEILSHDNSKYIEIYYQLFHKAETLKKAFHQYTNFDSIHYFDDLFKHSIYSYNLSEYLCLDSISENSLRLKITALCQSKDAFNYFFIYYFCNEYYFNIFEPTCDTIKTENFFDFVYEKLDKTYIENMKFLFIEDELPFFQFFMSIEEKNLSFKNIIKNMMNKNYKFNHNHIDFFKRYFSHSFYSYALNYMNKELLQKFTFEHGFVIDEFELSELDFFVQQINDINIPEYIQKQSLSHIDSSSFLSRFFSIIEEYYNEEDIMDNINSLYQLFENIICNMKDEEIKYTQNKNNTDICNLLFERFHIKQNIKYF